MTAAVARIDHENAGNAAFVLLDDGRVVAEHFQSIGEPVDRDTLFQVASLSKWVTAWGVMTLVDEGRINLDAPISTYLKRWHLPDGRLRRNAGHGQTPLEPHRRPDRWFGLRRIRAGPGRPAA
ncbi:MAG: beta-lactamase family protein [Caulobacteraceae bacterium]|nr:beta-lactamase family protein [Caulobacteraceae bacterium]